MTILEVKDLHKFFGPSVHVLRGINFSVEKGEFLGIIGSSGAGKSTLLRCINRLIDPTRGEILIPPGIFMENGNRPWVDVVKL
ncbi:MAG TPA: ATP-binding cassette domain-containing protein, partial [Candidatus Binatia bacterium]|nr:ATP-binding cassette domain-containing protein [Candidatus Binatia bacterium]